MLLIFAALNFVFFKGMSPLLLDHPISIFGSLIMAVACTCIAAVMGAYVQATASIWAARHYLGLSSDPFPLRTVAALGGAVAAAVLISYFILIGFSADLADEIALFRNFGDFSYYRQEWLWFCVMTSIPFQVLFFMALWEVRARAKRTIEGDH